MKSTILKHALIILSFCLLIGCNNSSDNKPVSPDDTAAPKNDTTTSQTSVKEDEVQTTNQQDYQYDAVSVITGIITTESFYGPPGYGENPKTDKVENQFLLKLEKPVNVISTEKETGEESDKPTVNNIAKIQLILPKGVDMDKLISKPVRLTGTFFHAHTGHHHTDILMDVQKVEAL